MKLLRMERYPHLDDKGQVQAVVKLLDRLVKRRVGGWNQPTKDAETGSLYQHNAAMLEGWRKYLANHFTTGKLEDFNLFDDLGAPDPDDQELSDADLERATLVLQGAKAVGDDEVPIEFIRAYEAAELDVFDDIREIWRLEYAKEPDVEVQEQIADGSADNNSHSTKIRVGSRGPTLSKINTP